MTGLPASVGVGFKPDHFTAIRNDARRVDFFEIHAENYMGYGGRPLAQMRVLSERFPISVHGVGLSIGGEGPLDTDHLARLKTLCDRTQPASFSEHLAWSTHGMEYLNDLLPLPYTEATLARVAAHIATDSRYAPFLEKVLDLLLFQLPAARDRLWPSRLRVGPGRERERQQG